MRSGAEFTTKLWFRNINSDLSAPTAVFGPLFLRRVCNELTDPICLRAALDGSLKSNLIFLKRNLVAHWPLPDIFSRDWSAKMLTRTVFIIAVALMCSCGP